MTKKLITALCSAAIALPALALALEPYAQCLADAGENATAIAACYAQYTSPSTYTGPPESATTTSQSWLVTSGYANNPAYMACHNAALAPGGGGEAAIVTCRQLYPLAQTSVQQCLANVALGDIAAYNACVNGQSSAATTTVTTTVTVSTSSASTANTSQTQSLTQAEINHYLTMINQLRQIIDQLTTPGTTDASAKPSCSASRSMSQGMSGEDVKQLQVLLIARGFLAAGNDTGFFGPLTEDAVEQLQIALGIVSSGDPESTGFGNAGPKTRAALGMCI